MKLSYYISKSHVDLVGWCCTSNIFEMIFVFSGDASLRDPFQEKPLLHGAFGGMAIGKGAI